MAHTRLPPAQRLDLIAIPVVVSLALIAFIVWFDNAQTVTTNGVFKALAVRTWMASPATASLDPSNYLYYPSMALLCKVLDLIGVLPGDPRHQLTIINACFAGASLCIVYYLAWRLTNSRLAAWSAALFHLSGAFFLNLAISNEDILPSYTLLLAVMTLASLSLPAPTPKRVIIVAVAFTMVWMMEWRLMFPTLAALLVALMAGPGNARARLGYLVLFLFVMILTAQIAVLLWGPQNGNVGPVMDLLWTGKGIGSGWGGFSETKLVYLWVGIGQYLVGGTNLGDLSSLPLLLPEIRFATLVICVVTIAAIALLKRRMSPAMRTTLIVFGITFGAGEFLNVYSQPQDPQMQLTAMPWLSIAWALVVAEVSRVRPALAGIISILFATLLLTYNVHRILPMKGSEAVGREALKAIEQASDPGRTVYLLHGFEQLVSDMFYEWHGDWTYFPRLVRAPTMQPKAKILPVANGFIHSPSLPPEALAVQLRSQIERAMELGYDVVTNSVWDLSKEEFESSMSTVTDPTRAGAVFTMLHRDFVAQPLFLEKNTGHFYKLRRRSDS